MIDNKVFKQENFLSLDATPPSLHYECEEVFKQENFLPLDCQIIKQALLSLKSYPSSQELKNLLLIES